MICVYVPSTQSHYIQIERPSKEFLKEFPLPEGAIEVPLPPNQFCSYSGTEWVEDTDAKIEIESLLERAERNRRLRSEVDPIVSNQLRWGDLSSEKQSEWTQYRTNLLNVPQQSGFPSNISWPSKPD